MSYASLGEIKKQARKNGMFFKKRDSRKSRENPTDLYPTNSTYSIGSDSKNWLVGWIEWYADHFTKLMIRILHRAQ